MRVLSSQTDDGAGLVHTVELVGRGGRWPIREPGIKREPLPLRTEARQPNQAPFAQRELQTGKQYTEAVFHAAAKIDGRRFFEILRRAGHFTDAKAEIHALGQHLVVENEVLRILQQRQRGQYLAAERAIASVVLGKFDAQEQVLKRG